MEIGMIPPGKKKMFRGPGPSSTQTIPSRSSVKAPRRPIMRKEVSASEEEKIPEDQMEEIAETSPIINKGVIDEGEEKPDAPPLTVKKARKEVRKLNPYVSKFSVGYDEGIDGDVIKNPISGEAFKKYLAAECDLDVTKRAIRMYSMFNGESKKPAKEYKINYFDSNALLETACDIARSIGRIRVDHIVMRLSLNAAIRSHNASMLAGNQQGGVLEGFEFEERKVRGPRAAGFTKEGKGGGYSSVMLRANIKKVLGDEYKPLPIEITRAINTKAKTYPVLNKYASILQDPDNEELIRKYIKNRRKALATIYKKGSDRTNFKEIINEEEGFLLDMQAKIESIIERAGKGETVAPKGRRSGEKKETSRIKSKNEKQMNKLVVARRSGLVEQEISKDTISRISRQIAALMNKK